MALFRRAGAPNCIMIQVRPTVIEGDMHYHADLTLVVTSRVLCQPSNVVLFQVCDSFKFCTASMLSLK